MVINAVASKYCDHLPLYRQSAMLARDAGVEISRGTMDGWVMRVGHLLGAIVMAMRKEVLRGSYIQADETTVMVQRPEERAGDTGGGYPLIEDAEWVGFRGRRRAMRISASGALNQFAPSPQPPAESRNRIHPRRPLPPGNYQVSTTTPMPFLPLPTCRRMKGGQLMSTRELIAQELGRLSEQDLGRLLAFLRKLEEDQAEAAAPAVAAESALAKDWLSPEEDAAWANL